MGEEIKNSRFIAPFNGPVEIGLRALAVLSSAFPNRYSMQRLVIFDYLVVHSDDLPEGPPGLHPKTPRRSGELLVRRNAIYKGLLLYQSRGLILQCYEQSGVYFAATERSATFLDVLKTAYVNSLRQRAEWIVAELGERQDSEVEELVRRHLGEWGAEFAMESVLWEDKQHE